MSFSCLFKAILILNLSILFLLFGFDAIGNQSKEVFDIGSQWRDCQYEMHFLRVQATFKMDVCVKLHNDHAKYCLDIEEFANSLKGNNEMYLYQERKQLKSQIFAELARQKDLILSLFQRIEQQYMESFAKLEKEENAIQALYNRIQTQNPLTLTEEEFTAYQLKQNEKEASQFRKGQHEVCATLMTFNSKLDNITLSFETLVGPKYETGQELLATKGKYSISSIGNLRNGIKFGHWKIITINGETIGGGQYNPDGRKHGQWINVELANSSLSLKYVQHIGKYKDGKRIDKWEIKDQKGKTMQNYYQLSGGGQYNPDGSKHGQWINVELANSFGGFRYAQHIGKYQDGKRIDQWEIQDQYGRTIEQMFYNQDGIIEQSK